MEFKITLKLLWNELRNYLTLFFETLGLLLYFPTALCNTIAGILRTKKT